MNKTKSLNDRELALLSNTPLPPVSIYHLGNIPHLTLQAFRSQEEQRRSVVSGKSCYHRVSQMLQWNFLPSLKGHSVSATRSSGRFIHEHSSHMHIQEGPVSRREEYSFQGTVVQHHDTQIDHGCPRSQMYFSWSNSGSCGREQERSHTHGVDQLTFGAPSNSDVLKVTIVMYRSYM